MTERQLEQLLKDYDSHSKRVRQATAAGNRQEIKQLLNELEKEYTEWFEHFFPFYAKVKCAAFHKKMARIIIDHDVCHFLGEIYRSGGKSVHISMGIPLFLYFTGRLRFMLLIGETEVKAKKLLADIQIQLKDNKLLKEAYGNRFQVGDWSDGNFVTSDGARFMALGFGQSPRGVRELAERPDYIAIDDVDNRIRCNNDKRSRDAFDYVWEDVKGCFDEGSPRRRFVCANNNFHKNTIVNQLKEQFKVINQKVKEEGYQKEHWTMTVTAVKDLIHFEPTWPEKTSAEYWRKKYHTTPYRSFMREYMHKHIQDGTIFKNEFIQTRTPFRINQYDGLIAYGDLSYKDDGDYKAIVFAGKKANEFDVLDCYVRKSSRVQAAKWLYDLYERRKLENYNVKYLIEGLFAQDEFVNDFDVEGKQRGYVIPVTADKKTKSGKFDRIESMSGYFERGDIFFNEKLIQSTSFQNLLDQLLAFQKGSGAHDDGPDALQSAIANLNQVSFLNNFEVTTTSRQDIIRHNPNRF